MRSLILIIVLAGVLTSCKKDIAGKWAVTDMKTDMKNVPQLLIDRARVLSLATSYEFFADSRYTMTIVRNEVDNVGLKHKGKMTINSKQLILDTDTVFFENNGIWKLLERSEFNAPLFEPRKMKIEKTTPGQIILSEKEESGIIYYTLDRVEK